MNLGLLIPVQFAPEPEGGTTVVVRSKLKYRQKTQFKRTQSKARTNSAKSRDRRVRPKQAPVLPKCGACNEAMTPVRRVASSARMIWLCLGKPNQPGCDGRL